MGGNYEILPDHIIEFIFNQTGQGDVVTQLINTGLLDYLDENIKAYQGKYQEDGSMLVTELVLSDIGYYQKTLSKFKYSNEVVDDIYFDGPNDVFIKFPTIFYKVTELEPDTYNIRFSLSSFKDCKKVFGDETLIGYAGASYRNGTGYANYIASSETRTLNEAKEGITKRGEGYYCFTSDEMGVLAFLNIYANGINGDILRIESKFLGISSLLNSGNQQRNYCPNIELDNLVAKITHNDGVVEYLDVPYIWGQNFSKLHITKYLNLIPKSAGNGIYNVNKECWVNETGVGLYYFNKNYWGTSGDKGSNDKMNFRCRPCFKGKIVETQDVEWFKSLPIIN